MKLILSWGYALAVIASLVAAFKTNHYSLLLGIPIAFSALFIVSLGPVARTLLDTASKDAAIFPPIRATAWLTARLSRWFFLISLIAFAVLLNSDHFVGAWLVGTYIVASNTIRWFQAAYLPSIPSGAPLGNVVPDTALKHHDR